MWEKAAIIERAEKEQCVQLTLSLKVKEDKVEYLISDKDWAGQFRGTSVGALHSVLEGSNPYLGP
eukprot:1426242-Pyramimonas_sp.AAC.1